MDTTTKTVRFIIEEKKSKTEYNTSGNFAAVPAPEKCKRKVTKEKRWLNVDIDTSDTLATLQNIRDTLSADPLPHNTPSVPVAAPLLPVPCGTDRFLDKTSKLIYSQICSKIHGYKAQDIEKGIYDPTRFVTPTGVIDLLLASGLQCHFCSSVMLVLYEYVREPTQWSLDRIDNGMGHNSDNVYAACLRCNLKRRTTDHDRFYFTKQVKWVKCT